ncbi:hypothetical protein [Gallintestinimicrobium sp.]|uniref:hypothetical protein n=1 Tax=Gallintestinimicrobium sp. TaxID=2981655 RepID=UPI00307B1608
MNTENVWKSGLQAAKLLSGSRLQIVFLLKKEPMSEKQLAGYMDEDEQGVGTELCVLQAVGLVSAEKESPSDRQCSFPFDRAWRGVAAAVQGTGTFWTFV